MAPAAAVSTVAGMGSVAVVSSEASRQRSEIGLLWPSAAAVALAGTAAALGATAGDSERTSEALLRASLVGAPLAVGIVGLRMGVHPRFARLLLAAGGLAFLTALGEVADPTLHGVGRAAGGAMEVLLAFLVLSCPTGRMPAGVDRRAGWALSAALIAVCLSALLLVPAFQAPSAWTSCAQDCHRNVLAVASVSGPFADALRLLGEASLFLIMLVAVAAAQRRLPTLGAGDRMLLTPVLAVGAVRAALLGTALLLGEPGGRPGRGELVAWLLAACAVAMPLAYATGLLRVRLEAGKALRRLADAIDIDPSPRRLERALRDALGDPTARLLPAGERRGGWRDGSGEEAASPAGRTVTPVRGPGGGVVGAIAHDADPVHPGLVEAAANLAGVALENHRLGVRAERASDEALRARRRVLATAERERRRIERDIHDGAQQQLVALRIELGLLEDLAHRDPDRFGARLAELERIAESALEELRAVAHGLCPPLLADRGIVDALRAAARRCSVPVRVRAHGVGRMAPEIESAVYFCVLEALQNVDKHARARRVVIDLRAGGRELRFSVRDDGRGIDHARNGDGEGLRNMRDRMAALGGRLSVESSPGRGTTVAGAVPLPERVGDRPEPTAS